jgi:hypothetical protein
MTVERVVQALQGRTQIAIFDYSGKDYRIQYHVTRYELRGKNEIIWFTITDTNERFWLEEFNLVRLELLLLIFRYFNLEVNINQLQAEHGTK